jgi:hypothetical protein
MRSPMDQDIVTRRSSNKTFGVCCAIQIGTCKDHCLYRRRNFNERDLRELSRGILGNQLEVDERGLVLQTGYEWRAKELVVAVRGDNP